MLVSTVTGWFASFLAASLYDHHRASQPLVAQRRPAPLEFELRHLHAVSPDARVLFHDVHKSDRDALTLGEPSSYSLRPRRVKARRPNSIDAFDRARVRSMRFQETEAIDWDDIEVDGPDVEDRETLLLLAKMTNNAYLSPGEQGWYDLGGEWNVVSLTCPSTLLDSVIGALSYEPGDSPSLHRSQGQWWFNTHFFHAELSIWLGTRRRWLPRACLCDP